MQIEGSRFGKIDVPDDKIISIPGGLIGFIEETAFVLHESATSPNIAWLQSVRSPNLAFPVMDGSSFGPEYPEPSLDSLAQGVGLATGDLAVLVIVYATREPRLYANALAPILIDMSSRTAAQVMLDPMKYSAAFPVASDEELERLATQTVEAA